jgi:hypothetical protein
VKIDVEWVELKLKRIERGQTSHDRNISVASLFIITTGNAWDSGIRAQRIDAILTSEWLSSLTLGITMRWIFFILLLSSLINYNKTQL